MLMEFRANTTLETPEPRLRFSLVMGVTVKK